MAACAGGVDGVPGGLVGRRPQLGLKSGGDGLELGQRGGEVLDDLAGDDVGGRQVVEVLSLIHI